MAYSLKGIITLGGLVIWAFLCLSEPRAAGQSQTQPSSSLSRWRSQDYSGNRYVGSNSCAGCHRRIASGQSGTAMSHAMETAEGSEIIDNHQPLRFRDGPYTHEVAREGNRSVYRVSDGAKTISEPILYGFGYGVAGQTYVFKHNGVFYESRVSFYRQLQNLDITMLHSRSAPASLEEALGRPMTGEAAQGCFSCHATPAPGAASLTPDQLTPGVSCERCHGPGGNHIAAVKAGDKDPQIFNPAKLDSLDLTQEFCGQCHQSFDTVMLMPKQGGVNNIRFQPYRIFSSRGHLANDPRISCVACHDPHDKMQHVAGFYDSKCLACHLSSTTEAKTDRRAAPRCPVSSRECVTCHMPKVELPEMHFKFTDHWIRVVRPGDSVPR